MIQTNTAISVNGLEKSFKDLKVLKNISFTVKRGSIFALLGSNGAGKTTMIKILTTLLKPDKGSIEIYGYDVVRQPDKVREVISLTGQFTAVDEVLTGRENLQMIGELRHLPDASIRANKLLEQFDLLDAANRRVSTYSGGMRRRLDIAMSLIGDPPILFLDEPTTGLDPQSRITMWKIIKDLTKRGITVFLTTQYLEEADELADQIAILNEGRIVSSGTAAELKKMLP
ncbi:MAG: ATP-binding cassette domain-containing protein, partial [Thermoanaerobacterium sp.]|nr:ATP-binding cassette domain-containing protein [Thermoanaerobacterium sp.]